MDDTANSHELFLFLASTAHDMKNSISFLSGTLENLLANADAKHDASTTPLASEPWPQMAHMLYQTRRLNDNLIQLLALYKQVGKPGYPIDIRPIEVQQLVEQVEASQRVLLKARAIGLELDFDPQLLWHLDEDLVAGVIGHAINNAINYTHDRIRLVITEADGFLDIRVEDNGAGFPASILAAGAAAAHGLPGGVDFRTGSTGLGLYFSSEVARMHKHRGRHGTVRLENGGAYGGGCFILSLP